MILHPLFLQTSLNSPHSESCLTTSFAITPGCVVDVIDSTTQSNNFKFATNLTLFIVVNKLKMNILLSAEN